MIYNKWTIEFYTALNNSSPIYNYIKTLPTREKAKIIGDIDLLKDYGVFLGLNKLRKINGRRYKGLWELRIKHSTNYYRVLYFLYCKRTFILLHCFLKKSNRTDIRHLELAKKRMIDYINRHRR